MVLNAHTSTTPASQPDLGEKVEIRMPRRVGQHDWRRAIRGQMPISTFAVAQAVVSYTNKDGSKAHPGNERLAADLSCTTKTVQRALRWLRTEGWLQLDQPAGQPGKSRKLAQEWSLTIPERWTSTTESVDADVYPPDPAIHQSSSLTRVHSASGPDIDHRLNFDSADYDSEYAEEWVADRVDGFNGTEMSTCLGMLSHAIHPRVIANKIAADRDRA